MRGRGVCFLFLLLLLGVATVFADPSIDAVIRKSDKPHLTNILLDRFIVIPEAKLLFCYIEKVGAETFNTLFTSIRLQFNLTTEERHRLAPDGDAAWYGGVAAALAGPADKQKIWFKNTSARFGLTRPDLEAVLADPAWTKAVFYRNPVVRFLSGFRSKCEPGHDGDWRHCSKTFGARRPSFSTAVARMATPQPPAGRTSVGGGDTPADGGTDGDAGGQSGGGLGEPSAGIPPVDDPHFLPQADFCGGLEATLAHYDFVAEMTTPATLRADAVALLHGVGIDALAVPGFDVLFPLLPLPDEQGGETNGTFLPSGRDRRRQRRLREIPPFLPPLTASPPSAGSPPPPRMLAAAEMARPEAAEATMAAAVAAVAMTAAAIPPIPHGAENGGGASHVHATHADTALCEYYTDAAMVTVIERFYRRDYDLFGMTPADICGF